MKLKQIIEQITSGHVASNIILGGFGGIIRRPFFSSKDFIIKFDKEKKKKIKEEDIMTGTGVPEKSEIYKKSVKKFKKNSLIKYKKKKKKSKVKKVELFT